jgi:hypothetical protein
MDLFRHHHLQLGIIVTDYYISLCYHRLVRARGDQVGEDMIENERIGLNQVN